MPEECVRKCVRTLGWGEGWGTQDIDELHPSSPLFLSLFLPLHRRGPWQVYVAMATLILPQAGWSAARWLKKQAREGREKERERSLQREERASENWFSNLLPLQPSPSHTYANNPSPLPRPPQSHQWHRLGWAMERPLLCSVVCTRWIQTSDCIYYSSSSSSCADSTAAQR